MTQIALSLDPTAPDAADPIHAVGFEIGWDHARHGMAPPVVHLHPGNPVRQGWQAGRAALGVRSAAQDPYCGVWLALRLAAWRAGRAFETVLVTPRLLAQIDVAACPVTRAPLQPLTRPAHVAETPDDAVVMPVYEGAGYAAGNLVVVSRRVAQARGVCSAEQAFEVAAHISAGDVAALGGLDGPQWQRLAGLLALATPTSHAVAVARPLAVLPPCRLRVLNPAQALQTVLTLLFTGGAYARRMADLAALMPTPAARRAFALLMNTLLAQRLAVGWSAQPRRVRTQLEDAWAHPLVQRRWAGLAAQLTAAACDRIVRLASRRDALGVSLRWLDGDEATDGWALDSRGGLQTAEADAPLRPNPPAASTRRSAHPRRAAQPAWRPGAQSVQS